MNDKDNWEQYYKTSLEFVKNITKENQDSINLPFSNNEIDIICTCGKKHVFKIGNFVTAVYDKDKVI